MEERFVNMAELLEKEEFKTMLTKVSTPEEMIEIFKEHGVDFTLADIAEIEKMMLPEDELDETALDNVAGGNVVEWAWRMHVLGVKIGIWLSFKLKNKK